ncbi:32398_t:CDS:2, partial [Racocetra persica]
FDREDGFSTVNSAIWRDGPREEWDEETGQWERASNTKVVVKYLNGSESDISMLINEFKNMQVMAVYILLSEEGLLSDGGKD